ncbi:ester cyclase [Steroidobacter agaridevorans]|nr:nuclear transport factor 2 family protein [Steroidobacter agaridevorans]
MVIAESHPSAARFDFDQAKALVAKLAEVKSRRDIESALSIYHEDATLLCPPFGSSSRGREQLRRGLEAFYALVPDYGVTLTDYAASDETLCAWGTISFTPTKTFRGDPLNGRRVATPVFILFRFRDNRIVWESFHFDLGDVARQSGVSSAAFDR